MAPMFLLLLLLLWLQGCVSGLPTESVYNKVQHREGETLSVQCSYKGRKNRVEGKVWCKVRKRKCEPGFARVWVKGPRYLLQDDVQAKVVNITMGALKRQDSGRYWCMRNSSGILYPMMGIQLEVSPAPTTQRTSPLTRLDTLKSRLLTTGPAPTSGPDAPSTSGTTLFTPGPLTLARLLPSTASGTTRPASVTGYNFTVTSATTKGPTRTTGPQPVTVSPSDARASPASPTSISTMSGFLSSCSPTTRMYHNQLPSFRPQDSDFTVLVVVLTFLPAPVMLAMVYRFWKKRHMGSYSLCSESARPWAEPPRQPEPLWKPA